MITAPVESTVALLFVLTFALMPIITLVILRQFDFAAAWYAGVIVVASGSWLAVIVAAVLIGSGLWRTAVKVRALRRRKDRLRRDYNIGEQVDF